MYALTAFRTRYAQVEGCTAALFRAVCKCQSAKRRPYGSRCVTFATSLADSPVMDQPVRLAVLDPKPSLSEEARGLRVGCQF